MSILLCILFAGDAVAERGDAPLPRVLCNGVFMGFPSSLNFQGASCSGAGGINAITVAPTPGPTGATGATGAPGATGATGAPGATYTLPAASAAALGGLKGNGATTACSSTDKMTGWDAAGAMVCGADVGTTSGSTVLLGNGAGGFANYAGTSCTNQFPRSLSTAGAATCASVADTDITPAYSGTGACAAHNWTSTLSRNAAPTCTRPDYSDLTGTPTIPADISGASYITKVSEAGLSNEFALGSLATGLLKNTTTTGVPTIAVAGTDYAAATSGSVLLLGNGAGGFSNYGGAASCTNQFFTGLSTVGASTCTTDTLASAQHANLGTTTTVLHGNAAGQPSYGAVTLTTDVTGILPLANGGTNKNQAASNGAVAYSDASGILLSAVGTAGQILSSNGAAAPTWIAGPRLIRVSGSNFTTTATTNTNITGLSITTAAATPYFFHCVLDMTGTATGGPRAAVVVTTSTVTSMAVALRSHTTSATTEAYTGASATGTQTASCTASCLTTDIPFSIDGMVNINANVGTITLAASNSTSGQTTTVKIGSMCTWWTP